MGSVFPIVLTDATATYSSGPPPITPTWTALGGDVVVTLTGYKKGKVSGMLTGTMQPPVGAMGGPIQVSATFSVKCL